MKIYLIKLPDETFFGGYTEHHQQLIRVSPDHVNDALLFKNKARAEAIAQQVTDDLGKRLKTQVTEGQILF